MNAKRKIRSILIPLAVLLAISLAISACGLGQLFSPTITPTPTLTFTPTLTPTLAPSATPTLTITPTSTLTPTPSCTVQNGYWFGGYGSKFTVDNCTITLVSFTFAGINVRGNYIITTVKTLTLNNQSIPIVNNEVQFQHSFENGGNLANSQTNVEFSGTFSSPTKFNGILQLPDGRYKIQASVPLPTVLTLPTATPTWFPPLTQWKEGIPIMPGAIDGEMAGPGVDGPICGGDPHSAEAPYCTEYDFHIKASSADISAYYEQQMQTLGWKSEGNGNEILMFTNGSYTLTITILPYGSGGDINEVKLSL